MRYGPYRRRKPALSVYWVWRSRRLDRHAISYSWLALRSQAPLPDPLGLRGIVKLVIERLLAKVRSAKNHLDMGYRGRRTPLPNWIAVVGRCQGRRTLLRQRPSL